MYLKRKLCAFDVMSGGGKLPKKIFDKCKKIKVGGLNK